MRLRNYEQLHDEVEDQLHQDVNEYNQVVDAAKQEEQAKPSHQDFSVENGASGTDHSDSELHCPMVAPDTILDRDRVTLPKSEVEKDVTYYIVMQSEDFESGRLHDEVFSSFPIAVSYVEQCADELAECEYLTLFAVNLTGIHEIWTVHG